LLIALLSDLAQDLLGWWQGAPGQIDLDGGPCLLDQLGPPSWRLLPEQALVLGHAEDDDTRSAGVADDDGLTRFGLAHQLAQVDTRFGRTHFTSHVNSL